MLLDEPPPAPGELRFSVFGIPVRVHPLFWIVTVLLGLGPTRGGEVMGIVLWVWAAFVSILVHEMGHALVALSYGWRPSITLHGLGGLATYQPTFYTTTSRVLISIAGPLAGFLLAGLVVLGVRLSGHRIVFYWTGTGPGIELDHYDTLWLNVLVSFLLYINIFWGLINLLPVLPLDGGHIARDLLLATSGSQGVRQALMLSVAAATGVALYAWLRLEETYLAVMFGFLAYENYKTMSGSSGTGGGWR